MMFTTDHWSWGFLIYNTIRLHSDKTQHWHKGSSDKLILKWPCALNNHVFLESKVTLHSFCPFHDDSTDSQQTIWMFYRSKNVAMCSCHMHHNLFICIAMFVVLKSMHKISVETLLFFPKQNLVNKGRRGWWFWVILAPTQDRGWGKYPS